MRPNPKRRPKAAKPMRSRRAAAALPAADAALARSHGIELAEQSRLRETICERIGQYRQRTQKLARDLVAGTNEAREIGLLILKDWERLPGGQMTIDFWEQQHALYVDPHGSPILLDQLKWFAKVALNLPSPLDLKSAEALQVAFSYRQLAFGAGGFTLVGGAPGTHAAAPPNHFLNLQRQIGQWERDIQLHLDALEKDANFGPVDRWPEERRQMFLVKIEPLYKKIAGFYERLRTLEA